LLALLPLFATQEKQASARDRRQDKKKQEIERVLLLSIACFLCAANLLSMLAYIHKQAFLLSTFGA
jgi:hypothetical protein